MEIRHLKDRMVRKCRKLAKTTLPTSKKSSRDDSFAFQTFIAPPDFRVKEMEKWFRDQQQRTLSLPSRPTGILPGASAPSSKIPIHRSLTNPEQSNKQKPPVHHKTMPTMQPSRLLQIERKPSAPAASTGPSLLVGIMSPPPLPVLLLSHREEYGLDSPVQQLNLLSTPVSSPDAHEQQSHAAESSSRPSLQRCPSCIKRNSINEFKTVSWADNQEWDTQVDRYASAAREAQASGECSGHLPHIYVFPLYLPASLISC